MAARAAAFAASRPPSPVPRAPTSAAEWGRLSAFGQTDAVHQLAGRLRARGPAPGDLDVVPCDTGPRRMAIARWRMERAAASGDLDVVSCDTGPRRMAIARWRMERAAASGDLDVVSCDTDPRGMAIARWRMERAAAHAHHSVVLNGPALSTVRGVTKCASSSTFDAANASTAVSAAQRRARTRRSTATDTVSHARGVL